MNYQTQRGKDEHMGNKSILTDKQTKRTQATKASPQTNRQWLIPKQRKCSHRQTDKEKHSHRQRWIHGQQKRSHRQWWTHGQQKRSHRQTGVDFFSFFLPFLKEIFLKKEIPNFSRLDIFSPSSMFNAEDEVGKTAGVEFKQTWDLSYKTFVPLRVVS